MIPSAPPSSSPTSKPTCASYDSPPLVNLGSACNYAILSEAGISTVPISDITGNIAVSPIAATAMTGFTLTLDSSGEFSTSTQVTGKAYGASYAAPTPGQLTRAVVDMRTAYADAGARSATDASKKTVGAATISGQTYFPGVYTFSAGLTIASDITFEGGPDDVFIIQIETSLYQTANTRVLLAGCAQAKNIFWRVKTFTYIGADALMQGIILGAREVDMITGSSLVGSLLTQTRADLGKATITQADTCTLGFGPTTAPSLAPSVVPSATPSVSPSIVPSATPSVSPSVIPSAAPSISPEPTRVGPDPTSQPTCASYDSPEPVDLGSACNYAILAKSGIATVPISDITGDIAVSPIASGAMTGFTLTLDSSGEFSTSSQVTGKAFAASYATPTPAQLTTAISDMDIAYADATARLNTDDKKKTVGVATIGGETFFPGVYTFTTSLTIASDITFEGGPDDVFIIQIETTLYQTANTRVLLAGCAQAKNIFWRVKTSTYIGADALMQGIILGATKVVMITGSTLVGSLLTSKRVDLGKATITRQDTCTSTA
jgi:hypothetical protein